MKEHKVNAKTPKDDQKSALRLKEKQIIAQVWAIAEPLCLDEGMELVFIEFRRETQGRVLRIYIDKHGGVTVDDCVNISRQMGDILDATLEDIGPYSMEVSSPGTNRPLGRSQDYDRFKGNRAHIKTRQPIDGRRNFKGILRGIDKDVVALQCDDKEIHLSLEEISIARLLNFNGEK
jgi:ribosome maturation factor RimP